MIKRLDCIVCPMSCQLEVTIDDANRISVFGNSCPRGDAFARQEIECPMRLLTTTIQIQNARYPLLPVITSQNVAKTKIFDIMNLCKTLSVIAPIQVGTMIVQNICGSGADLLASRTMEMRSVDEPKDTSSHK